MTPTELKEKYSLTYNSWRNMKQRVKEGAIIHQEFADFRSFLRHVGPRLDKKYTLDRLNHNDPEYAPDKVAWRDKYAQNSNKGNNVFLTDDSGISHTVAQWAKIKGINFSTLHKRLKNGWSEHEAIHGKQGNSGTTSSEWNDTPWPVGKEQAWERLYQKSFSEKTREECFFQCSDSKLKSCSAKRNELSEQIECYMYSSAVVSDVGEVECGEIPDSLQTEWADITKEHSKWLDLRASAKEHLDHARRLEAFVSRGEGSPARERKRFLALNPKPPRHVLMT